MAQNGISKRPSQVFTTVLLCSIIVVAAADRQIIALLKPVLDQTFGWTARDYASIAAWTQVAAACSLLAAGWLVDWAGPKRTLGVALTGWSLLTVLHAFASSVRDFVLIRAGLGAFEGAGTPSMMKFIAQVFPRSERGRVIGILNATPNVAAVLTPLLVALALPLVGWRALVVALGGVGLVLALCWQFRGPVAFTSVAPQQAGGGAGAQLRDPAVRRVVVAFSISKVLSDATWWLLLSWLPDIFHAHFGLSMRGMSGASGTVYIGAGIGAFCGGVLPGLLRPYVGSLEQARRIVMGTAALCVVPMMFVFFTTSLTVGLLLFTVALMAHQVFASNLFGVVTDWLPASLVGRATGIGAFCGNLGGASILWASGFVPMPIILGGCSLAYVLAWSVLRVRVAPVWLESTFCEPQGGNVALVA